MRVAVIKKDGGEYKYVKTVARPATDGLFPKIQYKGAYYSVRDNIDMFRKTFNITDATVEHYIVT